MAPIFSNYAKGRWIEWCTLPLGTDSLVVTLLQSTGLPTDATLKNCQYLSEVFAAGAAEATFSGYVRKYVTGFGTNVTLTVNTGTGVATVDVPDQVWSPAGGAVNNTLGALLIGYRQTSSAVDSAIRLISKHDFAATVAGGTLTATIPSIGTAQ